MFDRWLIVLIDTHLLLFGALVLVLLYVTNEAGFRIGLHRASGRSAHERDLEGISAITTGMLGLLAFTLGLTISIAQDRFEARRGLVVQGASAISTAWLRARLVSGAEGPPITALVEAFAAAELAYVTVETAEAEPPLIAEINGLQAKLWQWTQTLARRDPSPITELLITALNVMFDTALAERFAFDSQVPATMSWMLMAGSLLAIGAMGYHLVVSGSRQLVLMSLLLTMWSGGMVLIADLNRPRVGAILVDPAPLEWTIQSFKAASP
jgi:hypothetical protein